MGIFLCIILGYMLGSISPSYIVGRAKGVDIRGTGTHNLGASNTFVHFGRAWGAFVMAFDIFKAYGALKLCELLFPYVEYAAYLGGAAAVLGHCFPATLSFRGGRGLAALGGFVLGVSPRLFLILLVACAALAVLFNYGCVLSLSASVLFPIAAGVRERSAAVLLLCAVPSACVLFKHTENLRRIFCGKETRLREFIARYVLKN